MAHGMISHQSSEVWDAGILRVERQSLVAEVVRCDPANAPKWQVQVHIPQNMCDSVRLIAAEPVCEPITQVNDTDRNREKSPAARWIPRAYKTWWTSHLADPTLRPRLSSSPAFIYGFFQPARRRCRRLSHPQLDQLLGRH